jgi:hypothetical protein
VEKTRLATKGVSGLSLSGGLCGVSGFSMVTPDAQPIPAAVDILRNFLLPAQNLSLWFLKPATAKEA